MYTPAARRAFSYLASKIHPQLPLSPRESEQLLALLTTSFRAQLDHEHPTTPNRQRKRTAKGVRRTVSPARTPSSTSIAGQHLDAILTNPLFAVRPQRRGSDTARVNAGEVLRDPLSWFLDQVAAGAADIPKATACLSMLKTNSINQAGTTRGTLQDGRNPGAEIAKWLQSSGVEKTKDFRTVRNTEPLLVDLVPLLLEEGQDTHCWRWFSETATTQPSMDAHHTATFRSHLLKNMVWASATQASINPALRTFLRAEKISPTGEILRPAGIFLVKHILSHPKEAPSPDLYDAFLASASTWTGRWSRAMQSLLWLHHPTSPDTRPGLAFIQDPNGAAAQLPKASSKMRHIISQICLDVARLSLEAQKTTETRVVLNFVNTHFPEMVAQPEPEQSTSPRPRRVVDQRKRREDENLRLLDQLALG
ncbi:hypothetical protein P154DRAFT_420820 [Amniculicola lignicola CBS 123094]|uniref:Uncharacterized protein n=1 Tax=Amniculicola lignicola CBS 123094 TaxID=1392246 RepID=A0A6A5X2C9_9PLEO|nr:hypothetical protein P154DRAFT_420820 [Amniculicola lignicola CBS 123094]